MSKYKKKQKNNNLPIRSFKIEHLDVVYSDGDKEFIMEYKKAQVRKANLEEAKAFFETMGLEKTNNPTGFYSAFS